MTTNDFSKALNIQWWSRYDEATKRLVKARNQLAKAPIASYEIAGWIAAIDVYIDQRIDAFQTGKLLCNFPESWVPMFKEKNK